MDPSNLLEEEEPQNLLEEEPQEDRREATPPTQGLPNKLALLKLVLSGSAIVSIVLGILFLFAVYFVNDENKYQIASWTEFNDSLGLNQVLNQEKITVSNLKNRFDGLSSSPNMNEWAPRIKEMVLQLKSSPLVQSISFASKDDYYFSVGTKSRNSFTLEYYSNGKLFKSIDLDENGKYSMPINNDNVPSSLDDLVFWNSFTEEKMAKKWNYLQDGNSSLIVTATTPFYSSTSRVLQSLIVVRYSAPSFAVFINRPQTRNSKYYLVSENYNIILANNESPIKKTEFGLARKLLVTSDYQDIKDIGQELISKGSEVWSDRHVYEMVTEETGTANFVHTDSLDNSWLLLHMVAIDDYESYLVKYFTLFVTLMSIIACFLVSALFGMQINVYKSSRSH